MIHVYSTERCYRYVHLEHQEAPWPGPCVYHTMANLSELAVRFPKKISAVCAKITILYSSSVDSSLFFFLL